jgi:hypothetical protein
MTLYFAAMAALTGWAVWRKRDWCAGALAIGLAASAALAIENPPEVMPYAALLDGAVCAAMLVLWIEYESRRAWAVGFLGLAKTMTAWTAHLIDPANTQWAWVILINGGFLAQVLVAGGWVDELGARLDRFFARVAPGRRRVLWHGEA